MVPGAAVMRRNIQLAASNHDIIAELMAEPASGLGSSWATGANALDTAAGQSGAELAKMEPFFPSGLKNVYPAP